MTRVRARWEDVPPKPVLTCTAARSARKDGSVGSLRSEESGGADVKNIGSQIRGKKRRV